MFLTSLKLNALYLRQLLSYSNLDQWMVVNLEPDWLMVASSVPLWDYCLTSPPVKAHLWTGI